MGSIDGYSGGGNAGEKFDCMHIDQSAAKRLQDYWFYFGFTLFYYNQISNHQVMVITQVVDSSHSQTNLDCSASLLQKIILVDTISLVCVNKNK